MAKVIFVETTVPERDKDLCRIVDWIHQFGKHIQIVTLSTMSATYFDNLLWSFNKESFVPHVIGFPENLDGYLEKVFITTEDKLIPGVDAVVVADSSNETIFEQSPLSVHFVMMDDEEQKQKSRELWKSLASKGIERYHLPYRERRSWQEKLVDILQQTN